MSKGKLFALFVVVALAAVPALAATEFQHEVRGTVISTDSTTDTIVVRLEDGTTKTFRYDSTLDVLNIGRDDYVMVRYNEEPSGTLLAVQVDETERAMARTYDSRSLDATDTASNELPRTASPLPLLALLGLGSLGAGYRLRRKR
jgi:hypothetical protein